MVDKGIGWPHASLVIVEQLAFEGFPPAVTYVYVGINPKGLIKIGCTGDPRRRAWELGIRLLHVEPGDFLRERELHTRFATGRLMSEWYRASTELLAYLTAAGEVSAIRPAARSARRIRRLTTSQLAGSAF